jgi:hypothetical protein
MSASQVLYVIRKGHILSIAPPDLPPLMLRACVPSILDDTALALMLYLILAFTLVFYPTRFFRLKDSVYCRPVLPLAPLLRLQLILVQSDLPQ